MASNTQGIQQLLAAEKKAADKVGDARKRELMSTNLIKLRKLKWEIGRKLSVKNYWYGDHVSYFACANGHMTILFSYGWTNAIRENRLICNISVVFIYIFWTKYKIIHICNKNVGKARRLKQAKDEATEEIEKYRQERDKQFKDFEAKVWKLSHIEIIQLI